MVIALFGVASRFTVSVQGFKDSSTFLVEKGSQTPFHEFKYKER